MPPQIARMLCILFILYLYKIDFKRKSDVSSVLWIPLTWIMIIGSRLVSQWMQSGGSIQASDAYLKGNPIDRTIFSMLIIAGIFIISQKKISWFKLIEKNIWIFLLYLYSGISILWSDFLIIAFKRWFRDIGTLLMALIVISDSNPLEAIKTLVRRCAYVLIPFSILYIKYFPHLGRQYSEWTGEVYYIGVTTDKNKLGTLCLIFGFFFFWELITDWHKKKSFDKKTIILNIMFMYMIIWLFIKAKSATALTCFILGICILISIEFPFIKKNIKYLKLFIMLISFCILPLLFLDFKPLLSSFTDFTGHNDTFWGRVEMWPDLTDLMRQSFLTGVGYESFWLGDRLLKVWSKYKFGPNQAHNGYVEIYLNLGMIGLFLIIGTLFSSFGNINKNLRSNFEYGKFQMAFFVTVLLYNVTEAAFKGSCLIWFFFLLLMIRNK